MDKNILFEFLLIFIFIIMIFVCIVISKADSSDMSDFVKNEVLVKAGYLALAEEYTETYGVTVKSYSQKGYFAVLIAPDAKQAVNKSERLWSSLSKLSLNSIYQIAVDDNVFFNFLNPFAL